MPFKSQEFINGPELLQKRGTVTLRLDYEVMGGSGGYAWASVEFMRLTRLGLPSGFPAPRSDAGV
jgi:hypothetical protein